MNKKYILFLIIITISARYLPYPWTVLVADDWVNLARGELYRSITEALIAGLKDPNRPISMGILETVYYLFGTNMLFFSSASWLGNVFLVLVVSRLVLLITGSIYSSCVSGLFLAICPNIVETTHWSTQVINELICALVMYVLSALTFKLYCIRKLKIYMCASIAMYSFALFSYEAGILLPLSYIFLAGDRISISNIARNVYLYLIVFICYFSWRFTNAFGLNDLWHYPPHMRIGISLWGVAWNLSQVIQWWVGENLIETILCGWTGFMELSSWTRRGLLVLNALLVIWASSILLRLRKMGYRAIQVRNGFLFGISWFLASCIPLLISYTAPRLNVLPAIGVAIILGILADRARCATWIAFAAVPCFICMVALQGTTEQYRQAGEFNWRVYRHLEIHVDEWCNKLAIVFDTAGIRERQARNLIGPAGMHERMWANYGNALLFRGFVPRGMIERILRDNSATIQIVHDVENGAHREGDVWRWHRRFDPSLTYTAPVQSVYYVNLIDLVR